MRESDAKDWLKPSLNVSRETIERLEAYDVLLRKWNPSINLVSKSTLDQIWTRHFVDSAQLWDLAPENPTHWADFGSGGGFPGIVIAVIAAEKSPELHISLVESDVRKSAFLRQASLKLGLKTKIHAERAENLAHLGADVLSARALAPLDALMPIVEHHATKNAVALFPKGKSYESELTEAAKRWTFDVQKTTSLTDDQAVILKIEGVRRGQHV